MNICSILKPAVVITAGLFSFFAAAAQTNVYIAKFKDGKKAAVSYTFDDGLIDHYTDLFPKLKEYGIRATFAINGNTINRHEAQMASNGKGTDSLVIKKPRMTWAQIKEMSDQGQEMTSHGWAHTNLKKIDGEALRYEIQHNDTVIYEHTGVFPRTFIYPGNVKNKEKIEFCSRDRVGTRVYQTRIGAKRSAQWFREWIRSAIAKGEWAVSMAHGISRGYDHFRHPKLLYDHLQDAVSLQDSLWIGTFHDVAAYTTERDSIKLKVKEKDDRIIVKPQLKLNKEIFNYPLTLVVEDKITKASQNGKELETRWKNNNTLITFNPHGGKVILYKSH